MKKTLMFWMTGIVGLMLVALFDACKRESFDLATTSDVNVTQYLLDNPAEFSEFSKVLEITGYDGFLGAYGAYTCFIPNNEGMAAWLKEKGKSNVADLGTEELKELVQFHVVRDTIRSADFKEGRLRTTTMYGQYLTTGAETGANGVKTLVNRQARIMQADVSLGNGIVHVLDGVLKPEKKTLAQLIEANPSYSIFTQALKETGFYDLLNVLPQDNPDTTRLWNTVMLESNETLSLSGINSYKDLKDKYSHTGNPRAAEDSLNLFVAYHIIPGRKYLTDIYNASSHLTLSELDVVTVKLNGQSILINDDTFNGVHEPGSEVSREESDNTAANGVLHLMKKPYAIKLRFPIPVYWEVTDQPEVTKLANFRKTNTSGPKWAPGDLKDISWGPGGSLTYVVAPEARKFYVYHDDYLMFASLRTNSASNVTNWIEFKTPLLVKGRYKVWICIVRRGGGEGVQASFNGQVLPRILKFNEQLPAGTVDEVNKVHTYPAGTTPASLEALGIKMPFYRPPFQANPEYTIEYYRDSFGLLAGTINVERTDRHTLRLQAVGGDKSGDIQIDMIHFIPENEDQLWPKFNPDGSVIQKP